jgi:LuxR family maltose regulon positive regulatory protein
MPHRAVQTLLELASAYIALTDVAAARILLREVRFILQQRPHLGILPTQTDQLQSILDMLRETTASPATLTTAELRLLPLLSTHLTFREISKQLYLSRHTVKSHAISLYRKLGVSSRSQAIQRVQQTGLLGAPVAGDQADSWSKQAPAASPGTDHDATLPAWHPQRRHPSRPNRPGVGGTL